MYLSSNKHARLCKAWPANWRNYKPCARHIQGTQPRLTSVLTSSQGTPRSTIICHSSYRNTSRFNHGQTLRRRAPKGRKQTPQQLATSEELRRRSGARLPGNVLLTLPKPPPGFLNAAEYRDWDNDISSPIG